MTTITASCRDCGSITQEAAKVRSIILQDESEVIFLLDCPQCGELIVCFTDPRHPLRAELPWWRIMINDLRSLLKDQQAPSIYVNPPVEKREPK